MSISPLPGHIRKEQRHRMMQLLSWYTMTLKRKSLEVC